MDGVKTDKLLLTKLNSESYRMNSNVWPSFRLVLLKQQTEICSIVLIFIEIINFIFIHFQSITSSIGKASASSAGASSGTSSSKTFAVEKPVVCYMNCCIYLSMISELCNSFEIFFLLFDFRRRRSILMVGN